MTTEQTEMVVFKSDAGEYFVLPRTELERGRVPEEHRAAVERLVASAEGGDGGDEVQGYWLLQATFTVLFVADTIANGKSMWEILEEARPGT